VLTYSRHLLKQVEFKDLSVDIQARHQIEARGAVDLRVSCQDLPYHKSLQYRLVPCIDRSSSPSLRLDLQIPVQIPAARRKPCSTSPPAASNARFRYFCTGRLYTLSVRTELIGLSAFVPEEGVQTRA